MKTLTLIEPIEVPEGQEALLRQQWQDVVEPLRYMPGFLSVRLYEVDDEIEGRLVDELGLHWLKERPASKARFRFINIAEWTSLTHYETAIRSSHQKRGISFFSHPTFYHLYGGFDKPAERMRSKGASARQTFTLIVPFEVPEGQEAIFHKQWQEIVESAGNVEGSLGPGLYEVNTKAEEHLRSFFSPQTEERRNSRANFRFVNVAEWTSLTHYETAIRSLRQVKPISFPGYGAYYRIIEEYGGL